MSTDTDIDILRLPHRRWAHPFDHAQPSSESQMRGHAASSDAIGGYYGCQWDEVFRDHETGELYAVTCWDGTYSSKIAYSDEDEAWRLRTQGEIIARTKAQAGRAMEIRLSRKEWAVMSDRTFHDWFDLLPGEEFKTVGDGNRYKLEGVVGTISGTSVVVDPTLENSLGDPTSGRATRTQIEDTRADAFEDLAESLGF